jgi:hypothetical protein
MMLYMIKFLMIEAMSTVTSYTMCVNLWGGDFATAWKNAGYRMRK